MKVRVTYIENEITPEEIVSSAKAQHGPNTEVEVLPDSMHPEHLLYFAIYQLITDEQVNALYNDNDLYQEKIKELHKKWKNKILYILNSVIIDNEEKL